MKNSSFSSRQIKALFRRFHLTLFFVFIAACLAVSVTLVNETIEQAARANDYTSPINAGSIDRATLDRLNSLHTSEQAPAQQPLPEGRINPFGE